MSPLTALRILEPIPNVGVNGTLDVTFSGSPFLLEEPKAFKDVLKRMNPNKQSAWILFAGDSNMRHTYYHFVSQRLDEGHRIVSQEFGLDRTDLGFGGRWSDQEAVIQLPDGFEIRASFRFLHGSPSEFAYKTSEWHKASRAGASGDIEQTEVNETWVGDPSTIQPSKYAKWAADHEAVIDFQKENAELAAAMVKYENGHPDAVILTEGWGGIPNCDQIENTLSMFSQNQATKFVWAPIYVTNHQKERHTCFSDNTFNFKGGTNFQLLDLWDMAQTLPVTNDLVHIAVGGNYMTTALDRFENGIDALSKR